MAKAKKPGRAISQAERAAKGRPQVAANLPALTVEMLDTLAGELDEAGRAVGRARAIAGAITRDYVARYGTMTPIEVAASRASKKST